MGEYVVVLIVLVTLSVPLFAMWSKHKKDMVRMQGGQDSVEVRQLKTENRELEDRLRVLERIVTDKGYDVATQIEALRDSRRIDDELTRLDDRSKI
jgi:hypothetical protein